MDLTLNKKQMKKVEQHLINKMPQKLEGTRPRFSVCQKTKWKITTRILEISELYSRSTMGKAFTIPVVSIICGNCFNILFFDATELEIIKGHGKGLYREKI